MSIEKPLEQNLPLQRLVREEYLPRERNSYRIIYIQSSIFQEIYNQFKHIYYIVADDYITLW